MVPSAVFLVHHEQPPSLVPGRRVSTLRLFVVSDVIRGDDVRGNVVYGNVCHSCVKFLR